MLFTAINALPTSSLFINNEARMTCGLKYVLNSPMLSHVVCENDTCPSFVGYLRVIFFLHFRFFMRINFCNFSLHSYIKSSHIIKIEILK